MENKKFYVTTPIYYPSGRFHIGTAYTTILADTIKKYKKMRGFDAFLLTGVDEHGKKIETLAKQNGEKEQDYVDEMTTKAIELWKKIDIHYNHFIRTTDKGHEKAVQEIFNKLLKKGDIYLSEYTGWYCVPCETYFTELQLKDGKCPDCGRNVELMKEEAYFFNMKKYQKKLEELYENNPDFIKPESRRNELLNNFIKVGIEDLCVTRTSIEWGVKVKTNPKHVIYVWLDALMNYITALGYMTDDDKNFNKYWPADVQIIGKDIIRFHGIYWPIFLMALELPLPKQIYAHGFISIKNDKMSKSKGNIIYPEELIDRYGLDATKYFLLREMSYDQDMKFTPKLFVDRYNSDLANDLGNLLNRTIGMANKYYNGEFKFNIEHADEIDIEMEDTFKKKIDEVEKLMENLHISKALEKIWELISLLNKYIDLKEPWKLFKNNPKDVKLISTMSYLVENLRVISILIMPFLENTAIEIQKQLGLKKNTMWEDIEKNIPNETKICVEKNPKILFNRIDTKEEEAFLEELINRV